MANYVNEQRALDAASNRECAGSVLAVLGYILLCFAAIPVVWLWVGWRDGSMFWWWWTLGIATCGAVLAAAGTLSRRRAAKDIAALSGTIRGGIAATLKAGQAPSVQEAEGGVPGHERKVA